MSDSFDESDRLRRRQVDADGDATRDPAASGGTPCVVAKVVTASGPSSPGFFKCEVQEVSGAEVEGGAGTLTGTGLYVQAANLGGSVPASGTAVVLARVSYRWVFRYG